MRLRTRLSGAHAPLGEAVTVAGALTTSLLCVSGLLRGSQAVAARARRVSPALSPAPHSRAKDGVS